MACSLKVAKRLSRGEYFDVIQMFLPLGIFAGGLGERNGFKRGLTRFFQHDDLKDALGILWLDLG